MFSVNKISLAKLQLELAKSEWLLVICHISEFVCSCCI